MKASASRKAKFIDGLARGLPPVLAARSIGVSRSGVYAWKAADPAFAAAWDDATDCRVELVDANLFKLAMGGDTTAAIFFLKSHRPAIYNRRQIVTVVGDLDNPIGVVHAGGAVTNSNVHFYLPSNGRDVPALDDPTVEGSVNDRDEAAA